MEYRTLSYLGLELRNTLCRTLLEKADVVDSDRLGYSLNQAVNILLVQAISHRT